MHLYKQLKAQANQFHPNDENYCTVIALALCLDWDFSRAHLALKNKGRKDGQGTPMMHVTSTVKENGKILKDVSSLFKSLGIKTIREMQRRNLKDSYLILTAKHTCVFKNGILQDWTDNRCHRIIQAWRIEN